MDKTQAFGYHFGVNSRCAKRLVAEGKLVFEPQAARRAITAATPFKAARLRQAVATAELYLSGTETAAIATTLQVAEERVRQIVRLGIGYMLRVGWLKPPASPSPEPSPNQRAPAPAPSKSGEFDRALS